MDNSGPGPARPAEVPAEPAAQALPGQIAELVGEISDATSRNAISPTRRRRLTAALPRLARRSGGAHWPPGAQSPGLTPEELAAALIQGSARAAGAVGAAAGAAMVLPLPTAPVEVAIETLALVGIEIKLVAELHEVYGQRAPGSPTERMLSYVAAWSHRRGVAVAPAGLVIAVGSPLR